MLLLLSGSEGSEGISSLALSPNRKFLAAAWLDWSVHVLKSASFLHVEAMYAIRLIRPRFVKSSKREPCATFTTSQLGNEEEVNSPTAIARHLVALYHRWR